MFQLDNFDWLFFAGYNLFYNFHLTIPATDILRFHKDFRDVTISAYNAIGS